VPFRSGIRTTTFRGLQLQDSWRALDPLTVTFGTDYDYVKTIYQTYLISGARTRPTTPDNARETFGYFADASAKLFNGSLVLNTGARYDSIETIVRATPLNTVVVPGTSRLTM
jgi:outer membrane receptor protein involved in Fe transport